MSRVFQKASGYWYYWGYDSNGKRIQRSTKQKEKTKAIKVARSFDSRLARSTLATKKPAIELIQALDVSRTRKISKGAKPSTINLFEKNSARLVSYLGNMDLQKLTSQDINGMFIEMSKALSPTTIHITYQTLRYTLRTNRDDLSYDVDKLLKSIRPPEPTKKYRFLTSTEYLACVTWFEQNKPNVRDHFIAYVLTGCRHRELFEIEVRDIDLANNRLHIRGTKTKASDRWIPIHPNLRTILELKLAANPKEKIFTKTHQVVMAGWKEIPKDLKIPSFNINDLRRTFCSFMCNANIQPQITMHLLGHSTLKMVLEVYGQIMDETKSKAIAAIPSIDVVA